MLENFGVSEKFTRAHCARIVVKLNVCWYYTRMYIGVPTFSTSFRQMVSRMVREVCWQHDQKLCGRLGVTQIRYLFFFYATR